MSTAGVQFMTFEGFSPIAKLGPYRADDYWQLPEGAPVELIRGELVMSPAPRTSHQIVIGQLYALLLQAEARGGGLALLSPADVILSDDTILQPDVLYVSKSRRHIVGDRINGSPDLVIEVLSRGAERRDRVAKLDAYAQYGVPEFWIVDYHAKTIDFLLLENGRYGFMKAIGEKYQSPRLPELIIDLQAFWSEVSARLPEA
jgi:Uma2 family endonuclease